MLHIIGRLERPRKRFKMTFLSSYAGQLGPSGYSEDVTGVII